LHIQMQNHKELLPICNLHLSWRKPEKLN
jgi:hypothetical protein